MEKIFEIVVDCHGKGQVLFAWQPEGNFLATAGQNGLVKIYDWQGQPIAEIPISEGVPLLCLEWNSSGQQLAVLQEGNAIVPIWDITMRKTSNLDTGLKDPSFLAWSQSGPQLAIGTAKGDLVIYNSYSHKREKIPVLAKHPCRITCGAWSEANLLALGSEDGKLTISNDKGETLGMTELKYAPKEILFATTEPVQMNSDGAPVQSSFDAYHTQMARSYCGRNVGQEGYQDACGHCDGKCGPTGGCQCKACYALDPTPAIPHARDWKCPELHILAAPPNTRHFNCDVCMKQDLTSSHGLYCILCDYDVCSECKERGPAALAKHIQAYSPETISINMGGKSLLLLDVNEQENPIELAFQPCYGNIISHCWIGDGLLLIGFSGGYLVVIFTDLLSIAEEKFSGQYFRGGMVAVAFNPVLMRAAIAGENVVKIVDVQNYKELKDEMICTDTANHGIKLQWSPDGKILTCSNHGVVCSYMVQPPISLINSGTQEIAVLEDVDRPNKPQNAKQENTMLLDDNVESIQRLENRIQEVVCASAEIVGFMVNFCSTLVDGSNEDGVTALMLASKHGLNEIVSILCVRSDLNAKTKEGSTALMEAAVNNHLEALEILLSAGADINSTNSDKMNALMLASAKGNAEIVRYLLEQDATIDSCNKSGDTALMLAVQFGDVQTIRLLLEKGAAVTSQNSQGLSPLLIAAKSNVTDAASILLTFNPEQQLDIQDINGETALMVAATLGHKEIASLLLQHGTNAWKQNHHGFTAKYLANRFGHMEIEDTIYLWERENPPKLEQKPDPSNLPLTIEQFLECIDLSHLTDFFVENVVMETVSEFQSLNQRRREKIETQLNSSELEVLNAALVRMGIIIKNFLPRTTDRQDARTPAQNKTNNVKTCTNDVPVSRTFFFKRLF